MTISLTTPDGTIFSGEADSISLPTSTGEITVLPHHIPLISVVVPGTVTVRRGGEETFFAVSRGVVEIDGQSIRILADTADRAEELEEETIRAAKEQAEKLQTERRHDAEGFAEATGVLERELARLQSVRRHRARRQRPTHE